MDLKLLRASVVLRSAVEDRQLPPAGQVSSHDVVLPVVEESCVPGPHEPLVEGMNERRSLAHNVDTKATIQIFLHDPQVVHRILVNERRYEEVTYNKHHVIQSTSWHLLREGMRGDPLRIT